MIKTFIFTLYLLISGFTVHSQTSMLVTEFGKTESLLIKIAEDPTNPEFRIQLIRHYLSMPLPVLANLELTEFKRNFPMIQIPRDVVGEIEFLKGNYSTVLKNAQAHFLETNEKSAFELAALAEEARGKTSGATFLLNFPGVNRNKIGSDLLERYHRYVLTGLPVLASVVEKTVRSQFPELSSVSFNQPTVEILTPPREHFTEQRRVNLTIQVNHNRPIRTVRVGENLLYDRRDREIVPQKENYSQVFSTNETLMEGENTLIISAEDFYGIRSYDTIFVTNLSFDRKPQWSSFNTDSLFRISKTLSGFIPDSILVLPKKPELRSLIFSGGSETDSAWSFDSGLFLFSILTGPYSGMIPEKNSKLLLGYNCQSTYLQLLSENWLLPTTTFQSYSVVYLSGDWEVSDNSWLLWDPNGSGVNIKPVLERLTKLASSGNWIIIDGNIDNPDQFKDQLSTLKENSLVSTEITFLADSINWKDGILRQLCYPVGTITAGDSLLNESDYLDAVGFLVDGPSVRSNPVSRFPGSRIKNEQIRMLSYLTAELQKKGIKRVNKENILKFYGNWKYYTELLMFRKGQLTVEDLIIRMEEYNTREGKI